MNILRTPDDSTAVVRIMSEFDQFLSSDPKSRLTFDEVDEREKLSGHNAANPTRTLNKSKSQGTFFFKEREKDLELIKTRSKLAQLEGEMNTLESERKRARIEYEKDTGSQKLEFWRLQEKHEQLQQSFLCLAEQEKSAKEQLKELKKEYESLRNKSEQKVQNLQREKLKACAEKDQYKEETGQKQLELQNSLFRMGTEKALLQNKLEQTESQLSNVKRRLGEVMSEHGDFEELRERSRMAEHRIKELEQLLSRQEEANTVARVMQSKLTKFRELEKEIENLKEDNHYYRETNESNLLLKEKADSLQAKLLRAEQKITELTRVEIENEELKKKIQKWETEDLSGAKRLRSPAQLAQDVANLQKSQIVLLETQSELKSSAQIKERAYQRSAEELESVKKELLELKETSDRQGELNQRLRRRLFLVTAERDGCRRILDTYDKSYSSNYDPQMHARLQEAEARLKACHEHVEKLELELNQKEEIASEEKLKCNKLEAELNELRDKVSTQAPEKGDTSLLKTEIEKLKEENVKLQEQLDVYEIRKEQMHMQGYYDPTKSKVIHMSMNPSSVARQQRGEELERLRKENELLRKRLQLLEEAGGSAVQDLNPGVSDFSPENAPSVVKQVEDFKAQVASAEMKNQRLKEVFKKKIQEFREACYALTGYKVDVTRDNQYRLQSMYAERSTDDLLFESTPKGEMMLLATDFSSQLTDQIDTYLTRFNSIPAFLSSITLELFNRQTQTIVIN
ncbi:mitotic spindle assembly checkpoint protein MAD1-like isoform X1 [Acropora muricata]|uniref:mitotic spindle assembly checkpoint protein MAD1-like isoform X1 n=1 Tax=Acropora muricata TaxID=159855 RepID=UPI0034E5EF30